MVSFQTLVSSTVIPAVDLALDPEGIISVTWNLKQGLVCPITCNCLHLVEAIFKQPEKSGANLPARTLSHQVFRASVVSAKVPAARLNWTREAEIWVLQVSKHVIEHKSLFACNTHSTLKTEFYLTQCRFCSCVYSTSLPFSNFSGVESITFFPK